MPPPCLKKGVPGEAAGDREKPARAVSQWYWEAPRALRATHSEVRVFPCQDPQHFSIKPFLWRGGGYWRLFLYSLQSMPKRWARRAMTRSVMPSSRAAIAMFPPESLIASTMLSRSTRSSFSSRLPR